jgi:hypothetical protein
MNAINKITTFVKTLGRDTRGEDLVEKSSGLSNAGKVVMAAVAVTAAAAGSTQLVNNSNSAGDKVSGKINGAVGATAPTTQQATNPFGGSTSH